MLPVGGICSRTGLTHGLTPGELSHLQQEWAVGTSHLDHAAHGSGIRYCWPVRRPTVAPKARGTACRPRAPVR